MAEKIMLISGDGKEFSVDKTVAVQIVENSYSADKGIQIPQVTGEILSKFIEYYEKHVSSDDKELKKWDADFIKVDQQTLFDIIRAAKYLKIDGLHQLAIGTVADTIEDFSVEELRNYFNIKNDFTPEEIAEMKQNPFVDFGT